MTSSSDLEQIETRTLSLVRDFSFLHADDPVANSCKAVADAVAQQAVTSSEGGKRLRALLTWMRSVRSRRRMWRNVIWMRCWIWHARSKCFRPARWCMTTSSTIPICAVASRPLIVRLHGYP